MPGRFFLSLCCLILLVPAALAYKDQPERGDRRDRHAPELVVESGGRTGACDFLTFTPDGKRLLAVGDDKVVRSWDFADGHLAETSHVLRWNSWRQQRGAIYALALSPDGRRAVIGGYGAPTSVVALLDLQAGKVLALSPFGKTGSNSVIRALAFSPDGKRIALGKGDGEIWLWEDFKTTRPVRTGGRAGKFNRVRLLHFLDDRHLLSVDERGNVERWDLAAREPTREELPALTNRFAPSLHRATLSPDGNWLAAGVKGPGILLRSLDGKRRHAIPLKKGSFPRAVTFSPDGKTLAVSVGALLPGTDFYMAGNDEVRLYDLRDLPTDRPPPLLATLPHVNRAEFLAYHPDGKHLAVAGGDDHEVTLWDLPARSKQVLQGKGTGLWDVALDKTGRYLGFRDQRDPVSRNPNDRGRGPWRVFDLPGRRWMPADKFEPHPGESSLAGWKVVPDTRNRFLWYTVDPRGRRHKLPLNDGLDGMPNCYLFLPPARESDPGPRLAVGHYWGLSLYQLDPDREEAKRLRLFTGHQGEVTALAASADGSWLVSASNDQTISAWSLEPWPSQPQLGAAFDLRGGKLFVGKVDVGSPAWEAGLLEGDEVVFFAFNAKRVVGGPDAWLARLRHPVPGLDHYLRVKRDGRVVELQTTVRQRPLWRFFPMRDGEWVLWMWRNPFYDTSTKGDFAIGWHVNAADLASTPAFYRAERFRDHFERPDVIDRLLQTRLVPEALKLVADNPVPERFDDRLPPAVTVHAPRAVEDRGTFSVTLSVTPAGTNPDHRPARAELWINDYRWKQWDSLDGWDKVRVPGTLTHTYRMTVKIPAARLRARGNVLTFQSFNRLGGRSDDSTAVVCARERPRPRLLGLAVGINDYRRARTAPGRGKLGNLKSAVKDATGVREMFNAQKDLYAGLDKFGLLLRLDDKAGRAEILRALDRLAEQAGPDDRCVIFLAGHGYFTPEKKGSVTPPDSQFVFCPPRFDLNKPAATGVTSAQLFEKLARIPCRKLILIDACHSGNATANLVRNLTPSGQGPVVLAACDRNQQSYELPKRNHGVFTYAVLQAFGDEYPLAAGGPGKDLTVRKLFEYTRRKVPDLLEEIDLNRYQQVPVLFAPQEDPYPLAVDRRNK
jgi:WD40 repeat protein